MRQTDLYIPPHFGGIGLIDESHFIPVSAQKFLNGIPRDGWGQRGISHKAF